SKEQRPAGESSASGPRFISKMVYQASKSARPGISHRPNTLFGFVSHHRPAVRLAHMGHGNLLRRARYRSSRACAVGQELDGSRRFSGFAEPIPHNARNLSLYQASNLHRGYSSTHRATIDAELVARSRGFNSAWDRGQTSIGRGSDPVSSVSYLP